MTTGKPPPPCPRCNGGGAIYLPGGKMVECPVCHGSGVK
jgi:DnaJ-class molecular chaperone